MATSEKQLLTIYNSSQDYIGLINLSPEGTYIVKSINQTTVRFFRKLGLLKHETDVIGVELQELFKDIYDLSDKAIEYRMKNIAAVFEGHEVFKYESVFSPKGKQISLHFETVISPIIDDNGRCTQALYVARDITKSHERKAKIIASERRLSMVFNGARDTSFIFDIKKDGKLVFADANQAFIDATKEFIPAQEVKNLYGKDAHYFLSVFMRHPPEVVEKRLKGIQGIIKDKKTVEYNEHYNLNDGQRLDLEVTATPILNNEGECEQLLFVSRNITKKVEAQRALAISEKRLSTIYNSSQDIIALIKISQDRAFLVESINQTGIQFLQQSNMIQSPEKLIDLNMELVFAELFALTPSLVQERMDGLNQVFEDQKTITYRSPLNLPGKDIFIDFETVISPVLDPSGKCSHLLYTARNISESEAAKRKLIANERRLASIFNSTTDQMAIVDITQPNKFILEDTNHSFNISWDKAGTPINIKDLYNQDIIPYIQQLMQFSPSYFAKILKQINSIIVEKKPFTFEELYNAPNEKRYNLDISIAPILNKEGNCAKLLFVIRDVTLKTKAKEQLISKILETEDRERSRFAKELHDSLGQILTAASINFDIAKKGIENLPDDQQEKFRAGLRFLKEAIDESRNIAHNLMPQSISDFGYVLTIESLLDNLGQGTNIQFTFYNNLNKTRLSEEIELSLYRVTQEAINNILKHSKATQVTIQLIKHQDSLILTIEDNGKGFNKLEHIASFGLNSMKNRAQAHSGVLDIDSHPGKGTSITLEIPTDFVN